MSLTWIIMTCLWMYRRSIMIRDELCVRYAACSKSKWMRYRTFNQPILVCHDLCMLCVMTCACGTSCRNRAPVTHPILYTRYSEVQCSTKHFRATRLSYCGTSCRNSNVILQGSTKRSVVLIVAAAPCRQHPRAWKLRSPRTYIETGIAGIFIP